MTRITKTASLANDGSTSESYALTASENGPRKGNRIFSDRWHHNFREPLQHPGLSGWRGKNYLPRTIQRRLERAASLSDSNIYAHRQCARIGAIDHAAGSGFISATRRNSSKDSRGVIGATESRITKMARNDPSKGKPSGKAALPIPAATGGGSNPQPGPGGGSGAPTGGTFVPQYTQRSPMTYNLIESELRLVAHLNGLALTLFSIGSFWASLLASIWISRVFVQGAPTELMRFVMVWGTFVTTVMSVGFYIAGGWAIHERKGLITQVKRESVVHGP
jgi:hypothetical protein